jgi:ABC-type uncharacterized transport system permease subunit
VLNFRSISVRKIDVILINVVVNGVNKSHDLPACSPISLANFDVTLNCLFIISFVISYYLSNKFFFVHSNALKIKKNLQHEVTPLCFHYPPLQVQKLYH